MLNFARFLLSVKVGVLNQRIFDLFMVMKDVSNALKYMKLRSSRLSVSSKFNVLPVLCQYTYCNSSVNVTGSKLFGSCDYVALTKFTKNSRTEIPPKINFKNVEQVHPLTEAYQSEVTLELITVLLTYFNELCFWKLISEKCSAEAKLNIYSEYLKENIYVQNYTVIFLLFFINTFLSRLLHFKCHIESLPSGQNTTKRLGQLIWHVYEKAGFHQTDLLTTANSFIRRFSVRSTYVLKQ